MGDFFRYLGLKYLFDSGNSFVQWIISIFSGLILLILCIMGIYWLLKTIRSTNNKKNK